MTSTSQWGLYEVWSLVYEMIQEHPIAKLYGILKGKLLYDENAFSTTCTPA